LENDIIKIIKKVYPNDNTSLNKIKKLLNRSIQELYVKKEEIPFGDITIQNFKQLLDFVNNKLNS